MGRPELLPWSIGTVNYGNIFDASGKNVAIASTPEIAALIVDAVNRRTAFPSAPGVPEALGKSLAEAEALLAANHDCATVRDDGTCVGCPVGDYLGVSDVPVGSAPTPPSAHGLKVTFTSTGGSAGRFGPPTSEPRGDE